uniref:Sulfate transporter n=1 Tax=Cacopsylla melanoneura TaxID=428564 RepID=A0A8D8M1I0_9HEMI
MALYSHFDNDDKETVTDYGSLSKKSSTLEVNVHSFYDNRPYKQNEFDQVCKHQSVNKPGVLESCKSKLVESQCCHPFALLVNLFPILDWLPKYKWKTDLSQDVIAGITIAVVHIPQGMAYAILAAVPPIVGIYMAFFPVFIYMLMGTSRHLSMGTFSVICMMTSKAVLMYSDPKYLLSDAPPPIHSINNVSGIPPGSHNGSLAEDVVRTSLYATGYSTGLTPIQVASAVCFVVGVWHVILGALKLGSLSVLMSDSMISGFTSGTAFIVIASQIKHVFGISLPRHSGPLKVIMTIVDTINNFDKTNWLALEIAVGVTLALIFYMQFLKGPLSKYIPIPLPIELITVVLGTLASSKFGLKENFGISVVGHIPTGLPVPEAPPMWLVPKLILDGLVIAIIAFSINISMASILAKKMNYKVNSNQELLASGFSNIFASFFSCVPFAASLSRSLIQMQSGGQTQLTSGVCCGCLVFVLLYVGPFFEPLPHCVLTAIVIVAMKGMILQMHDFVTYWRESVIEGIVWGATFSSVVLLDIDYGLVIGICLSLVCVIFMSQKVLVTRLGRIFTTDIYVESDRYKSAFEIPGVVILRLLGGINFVTKDKVVKKIAKNIKAASQEFETQFVILDMMAVSSVDSSTVKAFQQFNKDLKAQDITMKFVQFTEPVRKVFQRCNFFAEFDESCLFPTIHDAVLDSVTLTNNNGRLKTSFTNLTDIITLGSSSTLNSLSHKVSSKL